MKLPEIKNKKPNEEQFEAYQQDVNKLRAKFISSLPDQAREKMEKIEQMANELNDMGIPYYYITFVPTPNADGVADQYACIQYNNVAKWATWNNCGDINAYLNRQLLYTIVMTWGNMMGSYPEIENPIQRFGVICNHAISEIYNPWVEHVIETRNRGWDMLSEIYGMTLPYLEPPNTDE